MLSPLPLNFATIVETGSITAAAGQLGLAKSAVSQNLKRLEGQLGVKLVVRTTRRMSVTPAGKRYYQRCKDILALSRQAETEMEAFGAAPTGPITITAPHALVTPVIAPALASVTRRFHMLEPVVIAEDRRLDLVAEGIDVAISVGPLADSSLRARRIGTLRDVVCGAPAVFADAPAQDDPTFADWLGSLPYIAHMREPAEVRYALPAPHGNRTVVFQRRVKSNTIEAMCALAREGSGVALLPDIAVRDDLKTGRLIALSEIAGHEPSPIFAVHPYDTLPPKSVTETIAAIHTSLAEAQSAE